MKAVIYICFLGLITGCAANQAYINRWNDMWTDMNGAKLRAVWDDFDGDVF